MAGNEQPQLPLQAFGAVALHLGVRVGHCIATEVSEVRSTLQGGTTLNAYPSQRA